MLMLVRCVWCEVVIRYFYTDLWLIRQLDTETLHHNTTQHNAVRAFLYPHPPPPHLVTRIARISHPAWHFPQFEQLRQWRQHKASEWHCNTSNDTRGVLWGYNMPLMMGRGELARILLPTLKYYKGSIWPHSQSPDWGDVGAKWRL